MVDFCIRQLGKDFGQNRSDHDPPHWGEYCIPVRLRSDRGVVGQLTYDPEEHDIFYYVSWGDGYVSNWKGPYSSGEEVTFKHAWSQDGDYTIIAIAMDQYGQKSQQTQFKLKITKGRSVINIGFNPILENFMKHLSNLLQILKILLH